MGSHAVHALAVADSRQARQLQFLVQAQLLEVVAQHPEHRGLLAHQRRGAHVVAPQQGYLAGEHTALATDFSDWSRNEKSVFQKNRIATHTGAGRLLDEVANGNLDGHTLDRKSFWNFDSKPAERQGAQGRPFCRANSLRPADMVQTSTLSRSKRQCGTAMGKDVRFVKFVVLSDRKGL